MTRNITAHVLNGITPCLRHLPVLFHGLRGVLRCTYPFAEILPGYLVVFPFPRGPGISIRYLHLLLAPFLRGTFSICILWPRSAVRTFPEDTDGLRLLLPPRGLSLMSVPP